MKIAFINFSYNQKTGIEVFAENIMRQLEKLDKENEYILFVNEAAQGFYESTSRISRNVVRKMARTQILKTLWLMFMYPVYSLIRGIDITIVLSGTSNFSLSPFTKNIVFLHDLGEFYIKAKYDRKRMIYRKFLTLPINKIMANLFIAVSQSTKKAIIEKLNVPERKINLIYCGTDDRIKKSDKSDARAKLVAKYNIRASDKIIITIGRIDPVGKNLIKLIDAADILRSSYEKFHLFLIGGGSNYSDPYLVPGYIKERNLSDYITLTGYISDDVLNDFYNAADLLVFPSIYEGFGIPLVEAMKCELPVACSDIDVFHEVGDDAVLYFDPYDASDIAEKISSVFNNEALRGQLIAKGRRRYPVFTWENSARKLINILRQP